MSDLVVMRLDITEQWKPVPGWEGSYEVSDHGRVRSVLRQTAHRSVGTITRQPQMRKASVNKHGYLTVHLSRTVDGKRTEKTAKIHRLVALAFLGNPPDDALQVNHKNGDKLCNVVSNLEWVTHSENAAHAVSLGLLYTARGTTHRLAKLDDEKVRQIRRDRRSQVAIARSYGVSSGLIAHIKAGKAWAHVK